MSLEIPVASDHLAIMKYIRKPGRCASISDTRPPIFMFVDRPVGS